MKRIMAVVVALGLVVGACGSDDDEPVSSASAAPTETTEAPSTETTEAASDDVTDDTSASDESTPTEATDVMTSEGESDESDDGNAGSVRSINDIPEECREQMASFLREIEPIVSSIDWETATLADFEAIATEFEAKSDDFDAAFANVGCEDLEFDDNETELLIEFAEDEAPGVIGFLEFIAALQPTGSAGDGSATEGALETCADGIDFVQNLIDTYDSFTDVPAAQLVKFTQLTSLYTTCSPEQLAFFDSEEFTAFLGE